MGGGTTLEAACYSHPSFGKNSYTSVRLLEVVTAQLCSGCCCCFNPVFSLYFTVDHFSCNVFKFINLLKCLISCESNLVHFSSQALYFSSVEVQFGSALYLPNLCLTFQAYGISYHCFNVLCCCC